MTIEEKVFQRKRFAEDLMVGFGFQNDGDVFRYESDFMGKSFHLVLCVKDGFVSSAKVFDVMNDEEYYPLQNEALSGPYVSLVRVEYDKLLSLIADKCCIDVLFASDQANRITDLILKKYGVSPDFPWDESPHRTSGVFRHKDNGKWFGLIMRIGRGKLLKNGERNLVDVLNLKIDPKEGEGIRSSYGVFEAYHMNHKSWISVLLDDSLSDCSVMELVDRSFILTSER